MGDSRVMQPTLRFFAEGREGDESGRSSSDDSSRSWGLRRALRFEGGMVGLEYEDAIGSAKAGDLRLYRRARARARARAEGRRRMGKSKGSDVVECRKDRCWYW